MSSAPLVYITGASSGIGQALALRYHQAGWRLALVARRGAELQAWVDALGLPPDHARVFAADVCDSAAITAAGRDCINALGLPDVVVAGAGISIGVDTSLAQDLAVMRRVFETNVIGTAATFQPFIAPMWARRRGTLVGVASVNAIRGMPGHGAYGASKAAVVSYCESLRGECRAHGVKVVTLLPGFVATPLTARNRYPMPFILTPEAFAERAFHAISSGTSYRVIPWQMGGVAKLLRLAPNALFDRFFAGRPRKPRQGE